MHSKIDVLEKSKRLIIWNGGSGTVGDVGLKLVTDLYHCGHWRSLVRAIHYWNQPLCRVSRALGKALNALGKGGKEHTAKKLSAKRPLPRPNRKILKKIGKNFKFF
jgi:hypothetical protein